MRTTTLLAAAFLASPLFSSCSAPGSQRADPKFDTRISRPAYPTSSGPRVLIDAAHRNVHTASGRYRPFAKLISNDGYRVKSGSGEFAAGYLRTCEVLVVSNAFGGGEREDAPAFSTEEIRAVRDWVRSGGSLLLIADHWPYGGAAAALSDAFGVGMSQGITEDSVNCAPSTSDPTKREPTTLVFSRENGLLADHPITNGRGPHDYVRRVVTFTGQSVGVRPGAVPFLRLGETAFDRRPLPPKVVHEGKDTRVYLQYGEPERALARAQGVALEFGKGRLVVLGEAAVLTAQLDGNGHPFGMNVPGNDDRRLALNIMHWLSRLD